MARILPFVVGQYLIGWGIEAKAAESDRRSGKNTEKEKFVWIQRITNSLFVCIEEILLISFEKNYVQLGQNV